MTLIVKDANQQPQNLSTGVDVAGNLVPVHSPASLDPNTSVASPVSSTKPLPVINAAGTAALDGSGIITSGGVAQPLFGGLTPAHGYLIANNSIQLLYVSDVGTAIAGGASIPIAVGTVFFTPTGYRPAGPVSLFGATTSQAFAARSW